MNFVTVKSGIKPQPSYTYELLKWAVRILTLSDKNWIAQHGCAS